MDQITSGINRPDLTRVVLTGSESVGKTTLARQLAAHYGVEHVPEFVRTFAEEKGAAPDFRDHGAIAFGQMRLEDEYAARAQGLLIHDTDLVSTVVYCEHYFGRCPQFIVDLARERRGQLYLLLDTDVEWVADGVRDRGERRTEMHALFEAKLVELECRYVPVRGVGEARLNEAVRVIDAVLG